jgi:hypothetical protein
MDNPRLKLLPGWDSLAQQGAGVHPEGWLPMLLDETGIRDNATVLSAAVPCPGRALPVACLAFPPSLIKRSLWVPLSISSAAGGAVGDRDANTIR